MMKPEDYMRQACHTTHDYMLRAVSDIDSIMNEEGYAKKHPELVGQYIRTAAQDFHTAIVTQQSVESICLGLGAMTEALNTIAEVTHEAAEIVGEATRAAARHLGTNDAATPMGALEHVAKELRDGLQAIAESNSPDAIREGLEVIAENTLSDVAEAIGQSGEEIASALTRFGDRFQADGGWANSFGDAAHRIADALQDANKRTKR